MFRIAALNYNDSTDDSNADVDGVATTKEAKESEAFAFYNKALGLQRSGDVEGADQAFKSLVKHPFLQDAAQMVEDDSAVHPGLNLLYSIHKNMAAIAIQKDDTESALRSYLEAVKIDHSEVSVWFKIGTLSQNIHNYPLSKLAFEEGLKCNPNHWPCLDKLITVAYALNDYWGCLYYISQALEKDCGYEKGIALRDEMFREQPSLRQDSKEMFIFCDPSIHTITLEKDIAQQFVDEALAIREKRRELAKSPPPPVITLPLPITEYTWKCVGDCLLALYDKATSSEPRISLCRHVDLSEYDDIKSPDGSSKLSPILSKGKAEKKDKQEETPMDVSESVAIVTETKTVTQSDSVVLSDILKDEGKLYLSSSDKSDPKTPEKPATHQTPANITEQTKSSLEQLPPNVTGPSIDQVSSDVIGQIVSRMDQVPPDVTGQTRSNLDQVPLDVTRPTKSDIDQLLSDVTKQAGSSLDQIPSDITGQIRSSMDSVSVRIGSSISQVPSDVAGQTGSSMDDNLPDDAKQSSPILDLVPSGSVFNTSNYPGNSSAVSIALPKESQVKSEPADVSDLSTTEDVIALCIEGILNLSRTTSEVNEIVTQNSVEPLNNPVSSITTLALSSMSPTKTLPDVPTNSVMPSLADTEMLEVLTSPIRDQEKHLPLLIKALTEADERDLQNMQSNQTKTVPQPFRSVSSSSLIQNITNPPKAHSQHHPEPSSSLSSSHTAHSHHSPGHSVSSEHSATPEKRPASEHLSSSCPQLYHAQLISHPTHSRSFSVPQQTTILPFTSNPFLNFSHSNQGAKPVSSSTPLTTSLVLPLNLDTSMPLALPLTLDNTSSATLPLSLNSTATNLNQTNKTDLSTSPMNVSPSHGRYLGLEQNSAQTMSQQAAAQALIALAQMPVVPKTPTTMSCNSSSSSFLPSQSHLHSPQIVASQSLLVSMMANDTILPSVGVHSYHSPISARQSHSHQMDARNRRGQKRKRERIPWDELGMKRRSARVRNTSSRKKEDSINLGELLQKFLPSSLLQTSDEEEEMKKDETDGASSISETTEATNKSPKESGDSLSFEDHEEEEVGSFIQEMVKNWGIIDLMCRFLLKLCFKDQIKWPTGLGEIFVQIYSRLRKHLKFPSLFGDDDEITDEEIIEYGQITLLWWELLLDQWMSKKSRSSLPGNSPRCVSVSATTLLQDMEMSDEFYIDDFWYVTTLAGQSHVLKDKWLPYAVRVYWLKARFAMMQGIMDEAVEYFERVQNYLSYGLEKDLQAVKLYNCKVDDVITKETCDKQLESLQRCQSLDETQKWYNAEDYEKAVEFLLKTFPDLAQTGRSIEFKAPLPERHSQLMLLQDSLFKLKDLDKCIYWGEVSFNEAFYHYRHASSSQSRMEWAATMNQIFTALNKVLDKDKNSLKALLSTNMVRYSNNLVKTIEVMMDIAETATEMPVATVLPWILLSRLIKHEECNLQSMNMEQEGQTEDNTISSSLMLLNVAHEYLGRHSWCTKSHGALLLYFMDLLEREMNKATSLKDELDMAFEQCVYCLYGHPNKKGKAKHLQDHNVSPIPLTWSRAQSVFKYYKPKTLPEFDSYKTITVSAELGNLLRRIFALVPDEISVAKRIDLVQDYIEGNTNEPPSYETDNPVLKELYYLLADYYFKNKEQAKAIKFYMYDLCANPIRLDSWAGMALARMSQLEQKLGSMELRMDIPIHKKSIAALRCFSRSVEIDDSQKNLWIEYGSLAYQLHSHASRQLKMESWFPLNEELHQIVMDTKQEMLHVAQNCYWKASECEADGNEEEWLHHYMMGKVMEKKKKHPRDYLEHYRQAAIYLHEDEALYPKKIVFNVSPPHLALEALELFFRLHVAILKQLLRDDGMVDLPLFKDYLTEAANSPFARGKEKRQERRERDYSVGDESLTAHTATPSYSHFKAKPVYHMTPQDHNYSKQKSSTESSDSDVTKESDSSQQENLVTSSQETLLVEESKIEKKNLNMSCPSPKTISELVVSSTSDDEEMTEVSKLPATVNVSKEIGQTESMSTLEKSSSEGFECSHLKNVPDIEMVSEDVRTDQPDTAGDVVMKTTDSEIKEPDDRSALTEPEKGTSEMNIVDSKSPQDIQKITEISDVHQTSSAVTVKIKDSSEDKGAEKSSSESQLLKESVESSDNKESADSSMVRTQHKPGHMTEPIVITDTDDDMSAVSITGSSAEDEEEEEESAEDEDKAHICLEKKKENEIKTIDIKTKAIESTSSCQIEISAELNSELQVLSTEAKSLSTGTVKEDQGKGDGPKENETCNKSENLRKELIDKCISALELCIVRYPTHYKTLYRLAHVYYCSPFHKNLEFAKDLLLGNVRWQSKKHMPAPGLFSERRSNNFFQGIWKIPTQEIDRSGSFATHNKRSVQLLLEILLELKDCSSLFYIHLQMNRHPDAGKKFLRDAERVYLAKMSYRYALDAVAAKIEEWDDEEDDEETQLRFLTLVYKIWNHGVHKLVYQVDKANELFPVVYQLACPDHVDPCQPVIEQAVKFCQNRLSISRGPSQTPESPRVGNSAMFGSPPLSAKSNNQSGLHTSMFTPSTGKYVVRPEITQTPRTGQHSEVSFNMPKSSNGKSGSQFQSTKTVSQSEVSIQPTTYPALTLIDNKSDGLFLSSKTGSQSVGSSLLVTSPKIVLTDDDDKTDSLFQSPKIGSQSDFSTPPFSSPKSVLTDDKKPENLFQSPKASSQSDVSTAAMVSPKIFLDQDKSDNVFFSPKTGSQSDISTLAVSPKGVLMEEMSPIPSPEEVQSSHSSSPISVQGTASDSLWKIPTQDDKSPVEISSDNSQGVDSVLGLASTSPDKHITDTQPDIFH